MSDNEALGLISCLPNTLSLFDLETGKILKEFQGHVNNEFKTESCFSNDYSIVFSGSEDGKIYHWEVKNKDENKNIDDSKYNFNTYLFIIFFYLFIFLNFFFFSSIKYFF